MFLLCLKTGTYFALEGSAAAMWSGLARQEPDAEILARVRNQFAVDDRTVFSDLSRFEATCVAKGFLSSPFAGAGDTCADSRPWTLTRRLPSAVHASVLRLAVASLLRFGGFSRAYEFAARRANLPAYPESHRQDLADLLPAFRRAEFISPSLRGERDCLPRSLALFSFLRERGTLAQHLIGVRSAPFAAHAWVEVDGRPLLQEAERLRYFHKLAALG
ncbi:MAG: lasso peptide biosynthesis B2 protein [Armatimonadota bacterium]